MVDIFDDVAIFYKLFDTINSLEINYSKIFLFKLKFAIWKKDCIFLFLFIFIPFTRLYFFYEYADIMRKEIIKNFNQFLRFPSESIFNF